MRQLLLKIYGQVHGVFFRTEVERLATTLGLVGYVKNVSDGTVEILAEGSEEALTKLKKWCTTGPLHAHVEKVEERWSDMDKFTFEEFMVEY